MSQNVRNNGMPSGSARSTALNVFISYSRRDLDFVDRLEAALAARGIAASVDRSAIEKGEEWWARIQQLIREADAIVFVLSPASIASAVCQQEIDFAERLNKRFVPIVARDLDNGRVPDALARLNHIVFHEADAFDVAVDQLVRALQTDIGWIREHTRLGSLAARWEARDRARELVLRGSELTRAETWLTTQPPHAPAPTNLHRAFVAASRRAATGRQRLLVGLSLAAVVLAVGLAAFAFWQRGLALENAELAQRNEERARKNEERAIAARNVAVARQLGSEAQALLADGLGDMQSRGVLLGIESMRLHPNAEATEALQQAIRLRAPIDLEVPACGFCVIGYYSAFSPDSTRLAVAGTPAQVIDIRDGGVLLTLGPETGEEVVPAMAIAYQPAGKYVATVAGGREVTLWSAETGAIMRQVPAPGALDPPLAFSGDGRLLAVAADGGDILVLSVPALEAVAYLTSGAAGRYGTSSSLAFDHDGARLAQTVEYEDGVHVWSLADGDNPVTFTLDAPANAVAFSASGASLAVGVAGTVRLIDPATGLEQLRLGETAAQDMVSVAFGAGDSIVGAIGWDGPALVWDVGSREIVHRFEHERPLVGAGRIESMSVSPDGRLFATHGETLRLWRSDEPAYAYEDVRWPPADDGLAEAAGLAFPLRPDEGSARSRDGRICLGWREAAARVTDCGTGAEIFAFTTPGPVRSGALSQAGGYAALIDNAGGVTVVETAAQRVARQFTEAGDIRLVALDEAAGIVALVASDRPVQLLSIAGGPDPPALQDAGPAAWAQFSDSGALLLTSLDITTLVAHEVATGRTLGRFSHDRAVTRVLWLEEPRYLATASAHDGTARVWDVQTGEVLLRWHLMTNAEWADLGATRDGRYLWFSGREHGDGTGPVPRTPARFEPWRPADLIAAACLTVSRELSDTEWQRYMPQDVPRRRPTCAEGEDRPS